MGRAFRIVSISLLALMALQYAGAQPTPALAADSARMVAIDLARTGIIDDIADDVQVCFSNVKEIPPTALPALRFSQSARKYYQFIPPGLVNGRAIMKFVLSNSSDSIQQVFFCPGFLFRQIDLFKSSGLPGALRIRKSPNYPPSCPMVQTVLAIGGSASGPTRRLPSTPSFPLSGRPPIR